MKKEFRRFIGLFGLSLALSSHAVFALTPGQQLSETEIAQLGKLPTYDIGGLQIRVIPSKQTDSDITLIVNKQGVVGSSRNEIAISKVDAQQAQTLLSQITPQPLSVQHFEPTGITVVRYADFGLAVEGLSVIKAKLPEAKVRLTIQFGKQVPY